jgi:hypothetical protein
LTKAAEPPKWSHRLIEAEKAQVRAELDARSDPADPARRLRAALEQVAALADDDSDRGRFRRYIFIMSALVQHERTGGLTDREVKKLFELAYKILRAQGIKPRTSHLSAMYGDLHAIRSQIFRKSGQPWQAAWEQQVSLQLAGKFPSGGIGFQQFAMANRALRLGHTVMAINLYQAALAAELSPLQKERAQFGVMMATWLAGRAGDGRPEWAGDAVTSAGVSAELNWHVLTRSALADGDFSPLLVATRRGGDYHHAGYVIEAVLWCLACESRDYLSRLPSMEAMRRNQTLYPQEQGLWYEAAVVLQQCYDYSTPLPMRLSALSHILENRSRLLTIDKELLVLAAATRWLARSKSSSIALLVYSEYRSLSLRLSEGAIDDVLGILTDLKGRDWVQGVP